MILPLKQRLIKGAEFFIDQNDADKNKEFIVKYAQMVLEYLRQEELIS